MKKTSRKQNHQSKLWLTKHLLLQIQKKHRLYRKFHKNPQNVAIKHKLKSLCNAITHGKEKIKSNILHNNSIYTNLTLPKLGIW